MTILLDKVKDHINKNPITSMEPALEALTIAQKHDDNNVLLESYYLYGLSLWENGKAKAAEDNFVTAHKLIKEDTLPSLKIYVISVLAITYALRYHKKEAFSLAKDALAIAEQYQIDDYHCMITLFTRIGGIYIRLSLYAKALEILLKAVSHLKEVPTFKDEGYIYSHLSIVQTRMKNYEESIECSKIAEQKFRALKNQERGIVSVLINRAMAYFFQGKIVESTLTLEKARDLCLTNPVRYINSLGLIYMNLCSSYTHEKIKNYEKGLENAKLSYLIAVKQNGGNLICLDLAHILKCNSILNRDVPDYLLDKYKTNEDILNEVLKLSEELDDLLIYKEVYNSVTTFYIINNNYEKAYIYQKKLVKLNEKISEKEKDENLFALNIKYETYQKEIKLQQLELEKKELELQQKEELKEINKKLEDKVKERTAELLAKNNELEQYAYIVAHDLKEPIRSIVGFSQLIEKRSKSELSDTSKELLQYVIDASYNMREMVDDLLKFSTIQVNKEDFKEIDLDSLFEKVFLSLRNTIKENKAKIIIGEIPKTIVGDNIRIRQLFQNIISNALKFKHPDRNPIIKIKGFHTKDGITFTIKDNGIGIKEEYHDKIFLLFRRLHTKEKFKGSGIGLSVCQKIVKQHGGNIWVTSEEGKGTTFHFTLS